MAKKTIPTKKARATHKTTSAPAKPETKQAVVLGLLRQQNGASIAEIIDVTGWQPHSVRGFFAGALKRRLKIEVVSDKGEDGVRRYFVTPIKS